MEVVHQVQDCAPMSLCASNEQRCLLLHSWCHYNVNISLDCVVFKMVDIHAVVGRKKKITHCTYCTLCTIQFLSFLYKKWWLWKWLSLICGKKGVLFNLRSLTFTLHDSIPTCMGKLMGSQTHVRLLKVGI